MPVSERSAPDAFEAYEETAAYVRASLSRSKAITEARDVACRLRDEYTRAELRAIKVWMRPVGGQEAEEFFDGEFDSGWIEVSYRPLNDAQRANLVQMWKVEPRDAS